MLRSFLLYLRRSLPMSSLSLHAALPIWAVPRVAGRFSDSETSWVLPGDFFEFNIKFFRLLWLGVASVLKKIVRLRRFFVHHISLESKLNGRQKVKGGNGSISASISTSLIASLIASLITLNLGVGCAPSCWPIFGFRTSWVLAGGTEGSFLCSLSSRFSGRGGGVGSLPRAWRASWGARRPFRSSDFAGPRRPRLYGFHTGTRSLSNRKGRGRRSGGREREPRRAGEASPKPPPKPPPKPRSGLCPELLADFRIPKPPGCSQGAQRAVFCAV